MQVFRVLVVFCMIFMGTVACSVSPEPYEYKPDNDIKPGRGLFSGEDGEFVIYGNPAEKEKEGTDQKSVPSSEK